MSGRQVAQWVGMAAACGVALVVAGLVLRMAPESDLKRRTEARLEQRTRTVSPGVQATIRSGDVTVERSLPAAAFALEPGQSLDPRVPPGPFAVDLTLTFIPGRIRQAYLGAHISNGSLIIKRDGDVLCADAAGPEGALVMTSLPVSMGRRVQQIEFDFESRDDGGGAFRAMWRPLEADVALPIPGAGGDDTPPPRLHGQALTQRLACVRCHASEDPVLQAQLDVAPPPILGSVGGRVRPHWVQRWLTDPHALKPRTGMPSLLHGREDADRLAEDLTHFLVSMGGPMDAAPASPQPDLVATGRLAYHRVGCVPCHGPLESLEAMTGQRVAEGQVATRRYASLGELASKTTVAALATFLADPLATRPSGLMPSCALEPLEAEAIASYLIDRERDAPVAVGVNEAFRLDAARIEAGRQAFAAVGCASCHDLGPDRTPVVSTLDAPPLESIMAAPRRGCLGDGEAGVPVFDIGERERAAIMTYLRSLEGRRCDDVPVDRLVATLTRLDCVACHAINGGNGPEPAISSYFSSIAEADLGDEGRLPPDLGGVGARLNRGWLATVLADGGRARPYMSCRMPQFGERNVDDLATLLRAAAGVASARQPEPRCNASMATIGRQLVGSTGFNCIQCHTIAGRAATGTPGPDLAQVAERLRFDAFARWVADPAMTRPGTRMPSFFVGGRSGFVDLLDGDAEAQIEAMWCYLSQGAFLPLPEGLTDPSGLVLDVDDEPIVLRTFMAHAGVRAIACGFPEQVHCAFDPERCSLMTIWEGQFLNIAGAWAARGGAETNPTQVVWSATGAPAADLPGGAVRRFRHYELDGDRRPVFTYDLIGGEDVVTVTEQPAPAEVDGRSIIVRRFTATGAPGVTLEIDAGDGVLVTGDGAWPADPGGATTVTLDEHGSASWSVEVRW